MTPVPVRIASRISEGLKRFQPIVESAKKRDVNESDTVVLMTGMISEILGFDKYADITTEVAIRGTFCDLALKINGKLELLLEAKAIGIELKDHHVKQAIDYAANKGLEWVILSNAIKWRIYKVIFSKPINHILLCEIDFLKLNPKSEDDIQHLFVLTKEAISKSVLADFFTQKQATSRFMIGNLVCSDSIVNSIKKELRQIYPDIKVDHEEIKNVLLKEVVKREILEGEESEDVKKKIAKAYRKKEKKLSQRDEAIPIDTSKPFGVSNPTENLKD
jgi:predicted type IV restriction endonuclease